ncbi:MAG: hypothetical protein PVI07_16815 [Anaerolineae bacterium]
MIIAEVPRTWPGLAQEVVKNTFALSAARSAVIQLPKHELAFERRLSCRRWETVSAWRQAALSELRWVGAWN